MITARNLTNKDLENALEVLRVVATHTEDNEPWASNFIKGIESVIEEWPLSSKEINLSAVKKRFRN